MENPTPGLRSESSLQLENERLSRKIAELEAALSQNHGLHDSISNRSQSSRHDPFSFLPEGGEIAELIRSTDWSKTELGAVENWPQSLRTAISICLNSRFPLLLWWGPKLIKIYNDAYIPILGSKHPSSFGAIGKEVWPEIWHIVGPMLEGVITKGHATWAEDGMLPLVRKGFTEECYFTFSYSPIHDESGGVGGVFTAVFETTARVLGERRLSTLRELGNLGSSARTTEEAIEIATKALFKNVHDLPYTAIYLFDPTDKNRLLLKGMTGLKPPEGGLVQEIVYPGTSDTASITKSIFKARDQRQLSEIENPGKLFSSSPGGPWPETSVLAAALPISVSGQESPVGLFIAGVSPRLELDDAYKSFLGLVAGQIGTAISTATAYEEERKRAEALAEIDHAKTAFFSNVSHEFRTPISLMLGPLEDNLADPDFTSPKLREREEIAYRNSLRLLKLVNTLLEFSRIEAGRVKAEFRPTDLSKLTAELSSTFRSSIEKAGLRFQVHASEVSEPAFIDRDMWEKIVLNLLSNAFKFTFEGEIEVKLTQSEGRAILAVRDTGTGIPTNELPQIFQRFHRVENAQGRSQEGSGIGLALIQELVRIHGGNISVQSELGKGSLFEVQIPLGKNHLSPEFVFDSDAEAFPKSRFAAAFAEEAARWAPHDPVDPSVERSDVHDDQKLAARAEKRFRVLLADDNADMRDYVSKLLSRLWNVEVVRNGEEALNSALADPPDLILSDVMMPKLDGFELIRCLKQYDKTKQIPVILLSARAGEESRIEGLQAGADDYLIKPFSAKELIARVETHLQIGTLKAEAVAERSKLLSVFGQAPIGIALLEGPDHVFTLANPKYLSLLFGGAQGFIGKAVREAVPEAIEQGFVGLLDRVYQTGEPFIGTETPIELVQPDGKSKQFFLNFIYQPVRDKDQKIHGIVAVIQDVTEQVQNRAKVEESEKKTRALIEALPQLVWSCLSDGQCDYLSRQWIQYTGIPEQDQLGLQWLERVIHPQDRGHVLEHWMGAVKGDHHYDIEYRIRRHDGAYRWFKTRGIPIRDSNGAILNWFGTCTDIQDRKEAEAKITFERHQLETIFQQSPAAMVLWTGPDFVFEKVNPHYQAIFPDRVLQGKPFLEACPEFKDQPFQALLSQVFETGEPFIGSEILARHADFQGGPLVDHYYDFTYMRVNDADGKPYGVYDHAIDVTEKVRAREAIQNQNLWLEEVLNRLPIGLIIADPDTANYRFTNHAARLMLGQAPKNARIELSPDKLIARDLNEKVLSVDETPSARAARGEELNNEVIILDKGESRIFVSCNSSIIPPMPGHTETVLVPFVDISDLKAKELELESAVKDLEDSKNKLLTTVSELEQERDLRERFVATLTHDLRTPLTAAKMSAQLVRRKAPENEVLQKLASKIADNMDRADEMIRDLLDANLIRAGQTLPLEIVAFNLNEAVEETVAELSTVHGDRFVLTANQAISGHWSESGIRRILENLCGNAIKYGDSQRPVHVSLAAQLDWVTIDVRNEGPLIPVEDQANLFQPFHRTSSAKSGGQKGWGLGLTLVKGIAEAHGGKVSVSSLVAHGTTFTVSLPLNARSQQ